MVGINDPIPQGRVRRTIPLASITARAAGGRVVAGLREKNGDADAVTRFHERTAERYSELLGNSKCVLMKAGQLLSMVDASVFGGGRFLPYREALSRLHTEAPPMDRALARAILQNDLGCSADEVFAEFTDIPMAAASIGQVHRAVLHDGRQVVVKIQYPGAAEAVRADLANTELLATFFRFASSAWGNKARPDLRQMVREISARIAEEVDYRHEAANITAFSELYADHPFIRIPEVIHEASGDRVLTMTYLDGMDWATAQQADQDLKNIWAEVIWRFVASSQRHANLFHADPHPGNYCFGSDGTVGFVDFGCVIVLPERQRHRLVGMARAALDGHKHDVRRLMIESGMLASDSTLTAAEAHQWMAQLVHEALVPQPVTYTKDSPQRAVRAIIDVRSPDAPFRRISVPDEFVFLSRITLSVNSIIAALEATIYARSILDDTDGIAEPITALGKQHHVWLRRRRLPYGLQPHDHP